MSSDREKFDAELGDILDYGPPPLRISEQPAPHHLLTITDGQMSKDLVYVHDDDEHALTVDPSAADLWDKFPRIDTVRVKLGKTTIHVHVDSEDVHFTRNDDDADLSE